jgi:hypothetical protein
MRKDKMRLKRLNDFDLNEGFISSLFGEVGNLFKSKKSKIESILKDIRKSRDEEVSHTIRVEKEISELPKDNSPEYRYEITNLNRQIRTYTTIKKEEINSYMKQAEKIIDKDPKLQALFSAGLARIEADTTEKMIRGLKPYKERSYLDNLTAEFDSLVKDATKKMNFYEEYSEKSPDRDVKDFMGDIDDATISFIELNNKDAAEYISGLSEKDLDRLTKEIKNFYYDIQLELKRESERIKKDKRRASSGGQNYLIPSIEEQEVRLRYYVGKNIEKIRSKINIIEKEIQSRRHGNN